MYLLIVNKYYKQLLHVYIYIYTANVIILRVDEISNIYSKLLASIHYLNVLNKLNSSTVMLLYRVNVI